MSDAGSLAAGRRTSVGGSFARVDASGTLSVLVDALGSTLALADAAGTLQTTYTYDPFGATTVSGAPSDNAAQYTGRENDGTGLYYHRARYYSPRLQRFLSEDPLGFTGGDLNLHAYVFNSPTNYVDPSGLCSDPGGPGVRYCIQAFIPQATSGLLFKGDGRGPLPGGGTFRLGQQIFQDPASGATTVTSQRGTSRLWFAEWIAAPAAPGACTATWAALPMGGRKINASCAASDGLAFGLAPKAIYSLAIMEHADGRAEVVGAAGRIFPSIEVWQYGGPGGSPILLCHYNASAYGASHLILDAASTAPGGSILRSLGCGG